MALQFEWPSGNIAEVNARKQLQVVTETDITNNPQYVGASKNTSENDDWFVTGTPLLRSPETDSDYALRVTQETLLDTETIAYGAQNTGKHNLVTSTFTNNFEAGWFRTNLSGLTTINAGVRFRTYAYFPLYGAATTYNEMSMSFTNTPVSNTSVDFGMFLDAGANPFAPTDWVYFRLNASGLQWVLNNAGIETSTWVFPTSATDSTPFAYTINKKHQYIISISKEVVEFWIDWQLYGKISTPDGQSQPCQASSLPFAMRHVIVWGAASGVLQSQLWSYTVTLSGTNATDKLGVINNRMIWSYQWYSGGTMWWLSKYVNNTNEVAAVPTNTTAALWSWLGGAFNETDTLVAATDGIIMSYQIPVWTAVLQGKRLRLNGVKIDSIVSVVLTGGGYNALWTLNFGHTAVSLATTESALAKARRVKTLWYQTVAAAAAVNTQLQTISVTRDNPVYVNPWEFIAIAKKKIGTAPTAGGIYHIIDLDYSWE